jgi:hypothetical protein
VGTLKEADPVVARVIETEQLGVVRVSPQLLLLLLLLPLPL